MKFISVVSLAVLCFCGNLVGQQDKPKASMMMKDAMAAKKMLMEPKTMEAARMNMMGEKSMIPTMVAKEMLHQEMMHDAETSAMIKKGAMTNPSDDKMMMSDKHVQMALETMLADSESMQMLFQELVARHIAAKKMEMMMKKANGKMMSMASTEMKKMMMDEKSMMMAKKDLMNSKESASMMARESLIQSLMQDEDVMAMVKKEAMMHDDPKMAPMMSDQKMKMAGDMMMKDTMQMNRMLHETMTRQMVESKMKMMMQDGAKKK